MKREIIFRGKCSHCDAWAYGNLVTYAGEAPEIHGFDPYREGDERWREITVDQDTVGQFTGMKDKKGVKIFEGDIIRFVSGRKKVNGEWVDVEFVYTVEYSEGAFRGVLGLSKVLYAVDVIGNIHDNPELLAAK